ncbi:MAG: GNAT family N-acetyltransferase [Desulfurococcales archaeon]|nr:GNAT family N-acetyltransferase [Desulfurococcales archaeon]
MRAKQIRVVEDPATALRVISETMGDWHAYYARAAVEAGVAKGLAAVSESGVLGGLIYYTVEGVSGRVLVVYYIASSPSARRQGVAKILLSEALKRERPDAVLATISRGNRASVAFFRSQGFEVLPYRLVEEKYGVEVLRKVSRLACGYEDEYAAVRPPVKGWRVIDGVPDQLVDDLFEEICYKPWRRRRYR